MVDKQKLGPYLWIVAALAIMTVCMLFISPECLPYHYYSVYRSATAHMIARTEAQLPALADIIQTFVKSSGRQPPEEIALLPAFLEEVNPGTIEVVLTDRAWFDSEWGLIVDSWGNPLRMVVHSQHHYTFISAGPNRRYENGERDDIVHDFDPWEFYNSEESQPTKQR